MPDFQESQYYNKGFSLTYNSLTKSEYTLFERISTFSDISKILDLSYKGKLYKWDKRKCAAQVTNNYKIRHSSITADYMLAVPSERNKDEKIYFFMYLDKSTPQNDTLNLKIFSAFPDCVDLTQGQEHPFTILEEQKVDIRSHVSEVLYVHPSYKKEKEKQLSEAAQSNIHIVKFSKLESKATDSVIAVSANPFTDFFRNAWSKLQGIYERTVSRLERTKNTTLPKDDTPPEETLTSAPEKEVLCEPVEDNTDEISITVSAPVRQQRSLNKPIRPIPPKQNLNDMMREAHEKYIEQQKHSQGQSRDRDDDLSPRR